MRIVAPSERASRNVNKASTSYLTFSTPIAVDPGSGAASSRSWARGKTRPGARCARPRAPGSALPGPGRIASRSDSSACSPGLTAPGRGLAARVGHQRPAGENPWITCRAGVEGGGVLDGPGGTRAGACAGRRRMPGVPTGLSTVFPPLNKDGCHRLSSLVSWLCPGTFRGYPRRTGSVLRKTTMVELALLL